MAAERAKPCQSLPRASRVTGLLALVLLGCSGPQTGGQTGTEGPGPVLGNTGCEPEPSEVDFGNQSLGFTAADILEVAEGARTAELLWEAPSIREVSLGVTLSFGPEQGQATLQVDVKYQGGPVRRVHYVPSETQGEGPTIAMDPICPDDGLQIEVVVTLRTAGEALDETFTAWLEASDPHMASLSRSFELDELSGSFAASVSAADDATTRIAPLQLQARWVTGGMSGTLSGGVEVSDSAGGMDSVAKYALVPFAHWPADSPCQVDTEVPVVLEQSPEAAQVVGELPEARSVGLSWTNAPSTELVITVAPQGNVACFSEGDVLVGETAGALLSIPVEMTLATADGRVQTTLPGVLELRFDDGDPAVSITGEGVCDSGAPESWAESCGVSGFDSAGADGLRVRAAIASGVLGAPLTGTVAVQAATSPDCVADAPDPDKEESDTASPGCAGVEWTSLDTGTFTID